MLPKLGQILTIHGDGQVEMMPWWHGWGCRPPLIASHIHIGNICRVIYFLMRYVGIWVHHYTVTPLKLGQILAILGDVKWKWCHDVMVEVVDHLWWLPTSIVNIHKSVNAPFSEVCRHVSAPLHWVFKFPGTATFLRKSLNFFSKKIARYST